MVGFTENISKYVTSDENIHYRGLVLVSERCLWAQGILRHMAKLGAPHSLLSVRPHDGGWVPLRTKVSYFLAKNLALSFLVAPEVVIMTVGIIRPSVSADDPFQGVHWRICVSTTVMAFGHNRYLIIMAPQTDPMWFLLICWYPRPTWITLGKY